MTANVAQRVRHLHDLVLPETGAVLCDLDGCLVAGTHVFPGAADMVAALGDRLWIVSNNSHDTAASLAQRLQRLGLPVPADRLVLAGEHALKLVATERPRARVALYGSETLREALAGHGLQEARVRADVVILARDPRFGLPEMAEIRALVQAGAALVVTNADATFPGPDGVPVPETGALLAGLLTLAPDLPYRVVGKPMPHLVQTTLARAGMRAERCVFVGDNPATDGAAAAAAGIPFCFVDRLASRREVA